MHLLQPEPVGGELYRVGRHTSVDGSAMRECGKGRYALVSGEEVITSSPSSLRWYGAGSGGAHRKTVVNLLIFRIEFLILTALGTKSKDAWSKTENLIDLEPQGLKMHVHFLSKRI